MSNNPFDEDDAPGSLRPRPEWIKWRCMRWTDSTKLLDAEQKGWYHNLLMYAANQGEPPGYLNDDEDELRQIAEIKDLPTDVQRALNECPTGVSILADLKVKQDRRWLKVRSKFRKSTAHPGLIYNQMMYSTLKDAYRQQSQAAEAGKNSASKRKENKELSTDVGTNVEHPSNERSTNVQRPFLSNESFKNLTTVQANTELLNVSNSSVVSSSNEVSRSVVPNESSLLRKKAESVFDEKKFRITEGMFDHLRGKYPEFVLGDWNWLTEKFKNVYYGKRYISWSRTFYNFVANQVAHYNYTPGCYKGRLAEAKSQQKNSAAERNAQLEKENDEYTQRLLQGSSGSNHQDDSEALPLTTDDIRNT